MKTVEEVRRVRLAELKAEFGSFAAINQRIERLPTDSTLSQIANASIGSKTKKPKTMGSDQARLLEEKLKKPRGWMDTDPELLGQASSHAARGATLPQALEAVIAAITALPRPKRKTLADDLAVLAVAPDSAEAMQRVLDALTAREPAPPKCAGENRQGNRCHHR